MQVSDLIERAALQAGSEYKVAKAMGTTPQRLSDWKTGRATCTAEDRVLLADIAGVDPFEEIAAAMLERWKGKPKGERLASILSSRLQGVRNF